MNERRTYNPDVHHRRSLRLREYDYSQTGAYFVTICAWKKESIFGEIIDGETKLNEYGEILRTEWINLPDHYQKIRSDEFIIMPNHFHGIIIVDSHVGAIHELPLPDEPIAKRKNRREMLLPKIIGRFKMNASKQINQIRNTPGIPVWQRNYYEHIIRNDRELEKIREYIVNNPASWAEDEENTASPQKS